MPTIGKKQISKQAEWVRAWLEIEKRVPRHKLDLKIAKAVAETRHVVAGKRVAFAWSGGKDSMALEFVMKAAGVKECCMAITNLEYPVFLQWVTDFMPDRLELINTGQDLTWLSQNLEFLFPKNSKIAAKWFKMVQHTGQEQYYNEHKLDLIILGRRKADGNHIGSTSKIPIYTNSHGYTRYSPLSDWSHEEILATCHYYHLPLPPIYTWPRGYQLGTHSWSARQWTKNNTHGFWEVWQIDKNIVLNASKYLADAKLFVDKFVNRG